MRADRSRRRQLARRLADAGFGGAEDEARQLEAAAAGDWRVIDCWASRRLAGEPLEWLTGFVMFMEHRVVVDRGVYVPRPQSGLTRRAIEGLPENGLAVDLCTGSGAIAVALRHARPRARIVATDIDPDACRCATKNGIEVYQGSMAGPVPRALSGLCDVVIAVVPYVPTEEMIYLPRDVRRYEPTRALDGGRHGTEYLEKAVRAATDLLHPGGRLLLELGGEQDRRLLPTLEDAGFRVSHWVRDDEGDLRGVEAALQARP